MDCAELTQLLSARPAAGLTPEQRAGITAHVAGCAACREKWGLDEQSQAPQPTAEGAHPRARTRDPVLAKLDAIEADTESAGTKPHAMLPRDIAGYEILGRLGRGGMSTVFRARQVSMDRIVALKMLPENLAWDEGFVGRFAREARSAAAVNHPGIIEVYDVGQDAGRYYIAMEYLEGGSLADLLRREGRLGAGRAIDLMKQVTAGLVEAHDHGVLHRDIKPSNILLTGKGRAKLADFGLAKRPGIDVSVTQVGQTLGTPLYLPPEAARGEPLDTRSDLYSLGATFYHLLAGRAPYAGATGAEVVLKHLRDEVPPLGEVAPGTPPALCRMIHRLMAKDPAERHANASELLQELEGVEMRSRTGQAKTKPIGRAVRRRPRTLLLLLLVTLLFLAAVATLTGVLFWLNRPGPSVPLFDGNSLENWHVMGNRAFPDHGEVTVRDGAMVLAKGPHSTCVVLKTELLKSEFLRAEFPKGEFPKTNYEVTVEARRVDGNSTFCHMAFPVGGTHCFLMVGADERTVALDEVDGRTYSQPFTGAPSEFKGTKRDFKRGQWYRIRLRVTDSEINAWVDDTKVVHVRRAGHVFTLPWAWGSLAPFGLGTWQTTGHMRNIAVRRR